MQFVFKRDEEGHERIYVGDVCVAQNVVGVSAWESVYVADGVDRKALNDAIVAAAEAGFWNACNTCQGYDCGRRYDVVTVDVPVADNAVLSVTVGGDES